MGPTNNSVQSEIFPLTYGLAWFSIIFSLYLFKFRLGLNWARSLILSFTFPFAFVGVFEEIWQNLWVVRGLPPSIANEIWMASWVVVGFSSVLYWRVTKKSFFVLAILVLGFGDWAATGYQQLGSTSGLFVPLLNWITKSLAFMLLAILLLDGTKKRISAPAVLNRGVGSGRSCHGNNFI